VFRFASIARWALYAWASLSWLSAAAAQLPPDVLIRWRGDPSCPRASTLEQQLSQRLAEDLDQLEPVTIDVEVRALTGSGYALTLTVQGASGESERHVELTRCAEVQQAAVVLIATTLVPERTSEPEPEPAPPREASFSPWSLRLQAILDLASVPAITGGPGVGIGYALPGHARVWVDARYLFARETEVLGTARADVDLFALALGGTWLWQRGGWSGGPLAELEAGVVRGKATENAAGGGTAPWLSAWLGASAIYSRERLGVSLSAALGVPFIRPEFSVAGSEEFYRTRPVSGRATLALSVALGAKKSQTSGQ
jgi:hypothetical protein